MKNIYYLVLLLLMLSCSDDHKKISIDQPLIDACDCENVQMNLPWLNRLIIQSQTDQTGNFAGTIWLENFNGKEIFVTNMMLGSGGIRQWFFDCSGHHLLLNSDIESYCPSAFVSKQHFTIEDEAAFRSFVSDMKLEVIVYSSHTKSINF